MKFTTPEIEINFFSSSDVITSSIETTTFRLIGANPCDCPAELPMD